MARAANSPWFRIRAEGDGPAIVYLYGPIGKDWWGEGNAAIDFAKALDELSPRAIELRVNSEGGDVFEGYAIYSALKRYAGTITAYVDGLAASAASYLIQAADEVVMGDASFMLIHHAWTQAFFVGNASDLREFSDSLIARLEMIDTQIIDIYEAHSDKSRDEIIAHMGGKMWLTAEEAVEWGLASRIDEGLKAAASMSRDAAKLYASIPEGITVVDDAGDTSLTIVDDDAIAPIADDSRQEPVVDDEPQEQPVARVIAFASGIQHL